MDRPHAAAERRSADAARQVARIRAGFAAARSRRAAAARRRGLLAALLLVASSTAWAVVGFAAAPWYVGAIPTALLVVTLVAGRFAVVAGTRNDTRWRQMIDEAERQAAKARTGSVRTIVPRSSGTRRTAAPRSAEVRRQAPRAATGSTRPRVDLATTALSSGPVGRAVRPSEQVTDVFDVIVADRGETTPSVRHASGPTPVTTRPPTSPAVSGPVPSAPSRRAAGERARTSEPVEAVERAGWDPVDVPPPAYTLKQSASRPEPAPLSDETPVGDVPAEQQVEPPAEPEPITSGSIDLDAVLERRRASGL